MGKELSLAENAEVGDCIFVKPDILAQYQARVSTFPQKNNRPYCLVVADPTREGIYWAVPITSSSIEKYKDRAKKAPLKFRFYQFRGKENCFNVSQMFPIIRSDINNVYVTKGVKAKIRKDDFQDLERTVSSILASPNTLRHVTNINAPMLLEMAQRRFQIEQNRASRTNVAENTKGMNE